SLTSAGNAAGDGVFITANVTASGSGSTISVDANRDVTIGGVRTGLITSASGTPIDINSPNHGLGAAGTQVTVTVADVQGNTAANGIWTATVVDNNNFTLNHSISNGPNITGTGFWSVSTNTTLSTTSATGGAISVTAAEGLPNFATSGSGAVTMG